ncbi:MAG TPA: peptide chain release factor N(5)-glutamine methyltransferase [Gemmatimonadota bacterium]|nr:peptide chain release factor N(5)-glutamine methyltransferase [Gemmatimonadota bacterium]
MTSPTGRAAERWTVLSILRATASFLDEKNVAEARLSAEWLLAHVLDCGRLDLYLQHDRPLDTSEIERYRAAVRRRLVGEPVQYITGRAGFRGLDLTVDRRVLIPRPETEVLVGEVLEWARAETGRGRAPEAGWRVVDLGTGSGAIAIALALELDGLRWALGVDRSPAALEVARANAAQAGAGRTRWVAGDLLEPLRGRFDAIVSNPPYVALAERAALPREVADWEPAGALFAGPRGDEALERIVDAAAARLRPGGLLALETGDGQTPAVRDRIEARTELRWLTDFRDHTGTSRGVLALAREGGP